MHDFVFWSSSNSELQNIYKLTEYDISLHLKALYLLSNNIIASAGAYFESEITRNITINYPAPRGGVLFVKTTSVVHDEQRSVYAAACILQHAPDFGHNAV